MTVLVDYDNLDALTRRRGVRYAIDRVLQTLGRRRVAGARSITCRLYGGWFDGCFRTCGASSHVASR